MSSLLDTSSLSSASLDSFEKEYLDEENQEALQAELAELVKQSADKRTDQKEKSDE